MLSSLRVLIAEDHPLVREALSCLLLEHGTAVETVERGDELLLAVERLQPDALLMDISMPGRSGLQLLPELRALHPELTIIMVTSHDSEPYRKAAFERGADGFVAKQNASRELWKTLEAGLHARAQMQGRGRRAVK